MPTPSVREQILATMTAELNAAPGKPGVTFRSRVDAATKREGVVLVLYPIVEEVQRESATRKLRRLKVRVEAMTQADAPADSALDVVTSFVVNTLMGSDAVGAFLKCLDESRVQFATEESLGDATIAAVEFEATYLTTNDPTVLVPVQ
jgi:hypothetical protein